MKRWSIHSLICIGVLSICGLQARASIEYPGPSPGLAQASIQNDEIILGNDAIAYKWSVRGEHLKPLSLTDKRSGVTLSLQDSECFQFLLTEGRTLKGSDLKFTAGGGEVRHLGPSPRRNHSKGRLVRAYLETPDRSLTVMWEAVLWDGSNYVRQTVHLTSARNRAELREIALMQLPAGQAEPAG